MEGHHEQAGTDIARQKAQHHGYADDRHAGCEGEGQPERTTKKLTRSYSTTSFMTNASGGQSVRIVCMPVARQLRR